MDLTVPIENGGSLTVSTTGCYAQAVEQLYGADVETCTRAYLAVRALPEQLLEQVSADERSACRSGGQAASGAARPGRG